MDRPVDDYQEFVRSRSAALTRLAFWMSGNWHDAEEVVQDALVKAYVRWPVEEHPDAYVRRIVVNGCRRRFRMRRREALVAELPDTLELAGGAEAVFARRALLTALASLSGRQRAVVVLRYRLDKPEAEVAAVLGCSVGTVKSQASKALARLRGHPALAWQEPGTPSRTGREMPDGPA